MADFTGATILITGAASGIGAATARMLAARGAARLILVDRDGIALARVAAELDCAHESLIGDVTDEDLWREADLAGLTHAVANAGIAEGQPIVETSLDAWRRVLSVNLDGTFLTLRAAMRAMAEGGGAIVLTASVSGVKPLPGSAAYGASKAALVHLARIAAAEGAPQRIRVNAIAPGGVETPIWRTLPGFAETMQAEGEAAAFAAMAAGTPLGRFATPDEVAAQIAFLLSDACATTTGACLLSDGGFSL